MWETFSTLYNMPGRAYHTTAHIMDCLQTLDALVDPEVDRDIAELALLWHDVIYVPGDPHNEQISADMVAAWGPTFTGRMQIGLACVAILVTRHKSDGHYGNPTVDAVIDCDLQILGSPSLTYLEYAAKIRREFGHVSDEAWRVGRGNFLAQMLERPSIYRLDEFKNAFEAQARRNMQLELETLKP